MFDLLRRTVGNLIRTSGIGRAGSHGRSESVVAHFPFPVYLINLERAEHRRRFALAQLKQLGVVPAAIHAVDGRNLELDSLIRQGVYSPAMANEAFSRQLSMPEIGCSLSHYDMYRMIVERGNVAALILEDDALLLPGFTAKLIAAHAELPDGWGVLHLNCPCDRYEKAGKTIVKFDGAGSLPVAASAYLVSRRGAELLLENATPIRYPADSLVGRGLRWGVDTYGVIPAITSINNVFPTQIQVPCGLSGRLKLWAKLTLARLMFRQG